MCCCVRKQWSNTKKIYIWNKITNDNGHYIVNFVLDTPVYFFLWVGVSECERAKMWACMVGTRSEPCSNWKWICQPEICQMVIIYQNNIVSLTFSIYLYAFVRSYSTWIRCICLGRSLGRLVESRAFVSGQKDHYDWYCEWIFFSVSEFYIFVFSLFLYALWTLRTKNVHANCETGKFLYEKAYNNSSECDELCFIYCDGWAGSNFAIARRIDTIKLQFKNK